jgi:hypothetical protein
MSALAEQANTSKLVAIVANKRVVEVWQILCDRTDYREREMVVPEEIVGHVVHGRRERHVAQRHQISRQEWGHFLIRRFHARRTQPWMSSLGLTTLVPGALLAAGSANQGVATVPIGMLVLQGAMVAMGSLMALTAAWRLIARRWISATGQPLESLGVSGHAMGFPKDALACESVPGGYGRGRFKGFVEVELPLGEWELVQDKVIETPKLRW